MGYPLRREVRDQDPEPRYPAAKDSALYAGALREIEKRDAEIVRLRGLLDANGIEHEQLTPGWREWATEVTA